MKKQSLILISTVLFSFGCFAQKITTKDSLKITKSIKSVIDNFENIDYKKFESISISEIYCIICNGTKDSKLDPYVISRKDFFENHLKTIKDFESWKRAAKSEEIKLILEKNKRSDITVYLTTWKKDELTKGHEGEQLGLYFKKRNGKYLFAGIETIP
ncbi:MAG: hypothetical protein HRT69_11875 [Flavobacteriaceae bacterium]|nr:hypothetical protein [Flavobacteriaceae bacterium]